MRMHDLPCLPLIAERHINKIKALGVKYDNPDLELIMFPQTWGSTALGFSGIGGQAMTGAYTTVVLDDCELYYSVFFGERLAYTIYDPAAAFFADLKSHKMKPVREAGAYRRKKSSGSD